MPGRLRYQACDDVACFAPTTADTQWTLRVVPAGTPVAAQHESLLDQLPFGQGRAAAQSMSTAAPAAAQQGQADAGVFHQSSSSLQRQRSASPRRRESM